MKYSLPLAVMLGLAMMHSVATAQNRSPVAPVPVPSQDIRMSDAPNLTAPLLGIPGIRDTSATIPSGDPARITLDELQQIALANNPTLSQAGARVRALQGKQVQVGLYPNPVIGYIGDEMGNEGTAGQQGGFLKQEIVTNGKRGLSRSTVGHEINQAEYTMQVQRWRILNDVSAGGYEVLVAQRTVELDDQLVRIGEAGMKAAENMMKAKEVSRVDLLQARVEANSAKLQLDNARNQYMAAWRKLAVIIGMPDLGPKSLEDELEQELPPLTWNESLTRLMAESPELAQARAGLERARCNLARECAERIPNVDLEGGVRYNNASRDPVATFQIGVPLQLYNRNQGNIAKAQAELSASGSEVRRVELELQARLTETYQRYTSASQQVQRYVKDILPDAKQSLEIVRIGYEQGEFGYLELLTAQRTYFRVNLAYVESLREYWINRVRIEGMLMTGGLHVGGP
jgi:outer membrane protein, heavy metal efflux system